MQTDRRLLGSLLGLAIIFTASFASAIPPLGGNGDVSTGSGGSSPAGKEQNDAPLTPQQRAAKVQAGFKLLVQKMQEKDWPSALIAVDDLDKLAPKNGDIIYNRACILARLARTKDALDALERSIDAGYVDADHIAADDDLQPLHNDPQFNGLVEKAKKIGSAYSQFPYEKGADIAAVKTVEESPEGGLRYRIRMSKTATAASPDRVVIWFHPSGGSMDNVVESLSPEFAKHHLALVVFTQKGYMNWNTNDVGRLNRSLGALGKVPGIDAKRPLGIGFSAGGQMMLQLYNSQPNSFGAMVLDAAYPIEISPTGQIKPQLSPPKDEAIKKTPILVMVGGVDGGTRVWQMAETNWRDNGVPLTLKIVPDRRHEWLFDNDERKKLLVDWLSDAAAGKFPGAAPAKPPTTLEK